MDEAKSKFEAKDETATKEGVKDFGLDLELLQSNLSLSLEERLLHHHAAYKLVMEIERARGEGQS